MAKLAPLAGKRQKGETSKAVVACNDYLRMGAGRSLRDLVRKYNEKDTENPPTKHLTTLAGWSTKYSWVKRAEQYDVDIEAAKTAYAEEMMRSGLALEYERVHELKKLFDKLARELYEKGSLWLEDVKQIGGGEYAERVEIERYNSALISDIRGLLDDLAKETGGRVQKSELDNRLSGSVTFDLKEWQEKIAERRKAIDEQVDAQEEK